MRVEQLSYYSQVLLLLLGVLPMRVPACSTHTLSQDSDLWRLFTTTGVGSVTHLRFCITECYL